MPTVAIVGASRDRQKFGNKAVRAFQARGYTVYPVNPHAGAVEGLAAFASVADIPGRLDMVSIYLPPDEGLRVLPDLDPDRIGEVWFNPGASSTALVEAARARGLTVIEACSIVGIGLSPAGFP